MEKYIRRKQELAYKAHVFEVYNDYLILPDGREVVYDLVKHGEGSCILPVTEEGRLVLIKQYRNSVDDITYEAPAGFIDEGESPAEAALRELAEETGYICRQPHFITRAVLAIGTSDEKTNIFWGEVESIGEKSLDDNEFIESEEFDICQIEELIKAGSIVDSKTLIAYYAYRCIIKQ